MRMSRPQMNTDEQGCGDELAELYRLAFERFGSVALWSNRAVEEPTAGDAFAITRQLRTRGGMDGRRLAERIERLCSAAD
jgi:hypothetical protein